MTFSIFISTLLFLSGDRLPSKRRANTTLARKIADGRANPERNTDSKAPPAQILRLAQGSRRFCGLPPTTDSTADRHHF
jgi:hypothetical protein